MPVVPYIKHLTIIAISVTNNRTLVTMTHDNENLDDPDDDISRYDTAIGWQPADPYNKQRQKLRRDHPEQFCRRSLFEVRPANAWLAPAPKRLVQPDRLAGDLWRVGEVTLLFGEPGIGKSILAMQIAESIARGRQFPEFRTPHSALRNRKVLYLDFQHTAEQFTARYSCPSPIPGKLPVKYRFSTRLKRSGYTGNTEVPAEFRNDFARYFRHSIQMALDEAEASVIIIDNLANFDPGSTSAASQIKTMRSLKLLAMTAGVSVLAIADAKTKRRTSRASRSAASHFSLFTVHSSLTLNDLSAGPQLAESADSVFALCPSTFAPDIRYIKSLKNRTANDSDRVSDPNSPFTTHHSPLVSIYRLERTEGPGKVENEKRKTKSSALSTFHSPPSDSCSLSTISYSLTAKPFLALTYLGTAPETEAIRDHEREAHEAHLAHEAQLKKLARRSGKDILVDGVLDGSYARYLKS